MKITNIRSTKAILLSIVTLSLGFGLHAETQEELEERIAQLEQELAETKQEFAANKKPEKIKIGPLTIGGCIRTNFVMGDYGDSSSGHPTRSFKDKGNMELDVFRLNIDFEQGDLSGKLEYRWYDGYNMIHTAWIGYDLGEFGDIKAGVVRVPFGPGAYGVSNSWFFDQHFYVGLADDMDLGITWSNTYGNLDLDFAYFIASEGSYSGGNTSNTFGSSTNSARYSYDFVRDGNSDGYNEEHQFNARAIYTLEGFGDIGASLQYGLLESEGFVKDGDHMAASIHMSNPMGKFTLVSQLTYYNINISDDNPWASDKLILMGAYDYAETIATEAFIPAVSLRYSIDTPSIAWLDNVTPYVEYSSIIKCESSFNDSDMFVLGAAWSHGGWYVYSDLALSNGNYFVGNEHYTTFGENPDDEWQTRLNINLGYYF